MACTFVQVVVNNPVPEMQTREGGAFEDTMLLLEIIKEKKIEEMKKLKVLILTKL